MGIGHLAALDLEQSGSEVDGSRTGYHSSEVGVIPDDWSVVKLRDLAFIQRGASPRPIDSPVWYDNSSRVGWVRISDVTESNDKYLERTKDYLSQRGIAESRFLPSGSLIMSICATVGLPVMTRIDACIHDGFVGFTNLRGVSQEFLYYKLKEVESVFRGLGQTGSQSNLNSDLVRNQLIALPPIAEQRAIAVALSDVDRLLGALDRLLAKKRAIKLAAMQQLLTGKTRLPGFGGEWETKQLGGLGSFSKGKGIKKDDVVSAGIPCVRYGEIYTRHTDYIKSFHSFIPLRVANKSQRLRKGALLFAASGETAEEIGKCVAFLGDEEAYAGGDIIIFSPVGQDSMYLGYLLNHPAVAAEKARMGQGDAVVHIGVKHLAELELSLPAEDEQRAIATVLSDMDEEIAALERRREKTVAVKQGMMQVLLTGRVRLVAPTEPGADRP